ncbi:MAG: DUF6600 domain-containing protein [Syntrophomonadaceae bacterium]
MRHPRNLFAALLIASAALLAEPPSAHAEVAVSISVFHDDLAPYGRWVGVGSYGSCFVPRVAAGWAPYVDGQWVYTDYGWTWVSDDPFGDVPFHYGSWAWADPYGWIWVPGTVWAPAWVTWAYGDDYVGWAPVPPSFGFTVSRYVGSPVVLPATRYVFVPTRQFVGVPVAGVRLPVERNSVIFARTVKTTDYRVSGGVVRTAGPPTARIERVAGHKIAPVSIDRVRARPTTLAEAGVANASRIRVAAPASETRKLASEKPAESRAAAKTAPAGKPAKAESRSTAATLAHARETTAHAHEAAPPAPKNPATTNAAHGKAETRPSETHTASGQGHATAQGHAPAPSAKEKKPQAPPREKATAHEAPPNAQARPAEAPLAEPPKAEPREETRVASQHGNPPAHAPAAHRPPPANPKPPEKKPEPERKPE